MIITKPEEIEIYRLLTLKARLKLEIKGLKCRGPSALSILKKDGYVKSRTSKDALEELNVILAYLKLDGHAEP